MTMQANCRREPLPVCIIRITIFPCGTPSAKGYEDALKAIESGGLFQKLQQYVSGFLETSTHACAVVEFEEDRP